MVICDDEPTGLANNPARGSAPARDESPEVLVDSDALVSESESEDGEAGVVMTAVRPSPSVRSSGDLAASQDDGNFGSSDVIVTGSCRGRGRRGARAGKQVTAPSTSADARPTATPMDSTPDSNPVLPGKTLITASRGSSSAQGKTGPPAGAPPARAGPRDPPQPRSSLPLEQPAGIAGDSASQPTARVVDLFAGALAHMESIRFAPAARPPAGFLDATTTPASVLQFDRSLFTPELLSQYRSDLFFRLSDRNLTTADKKKAARYPTQLARYLAVTSPPLPSAILAPSAGRLADHTLYLRYGYGGSISKSAAETMAVLHKAIALAVQKSHKNSVTASVCVYDRERDAWIAPTRMTTDSAEHLSVVFEVRHSCDMSYSDLIHRLRFAFLHAFGLGRESVFGIAAPVVRCVCARV
jgi:hypothetical protein